MEELFYGPYEQTQIVRSQPRRRRRGGRKSNKNRGESQVRDRGAEPPCTREVQTVLFMVPICCDKFERKVQKELQNLHDVESVVCDRWKQQVKVTSSIDPEELLERLQKIKQRSTFWPLQIKKDRMEIGAPILALQSTGKLHFDRAS